MACPNTADGLAAEEGGDDRVLPNAGLADVEADACEGWKKLEPLVDPKVNPFGTSPLVEGTDPETVISDFAFSTSGFAGSTGFGCSASFSFELSVIVFFGVSGVGTDASIAANDFNASLFSVGDCTLEGANENVGVALVLEPLNEKTGVCSGFFAENEKAGVEAASNVKAGDVLLVVGGANEVMGELVASLAVLLGVGSSAKSVRTVGDSARLEKSVSFPPLLKEGRKEPVVFTVPPSKAKLGLEATSGLDGNAGPVSSSSLLSSPSEICSSSSPSPSSSS